MSDNGIMQGFTLPSKEVKRLRKIHRRLRQRHEADVVKAIVLLGTGWTERQVAEALLVDERTIRRYVDGYRQNPRIRFWEMNYSGSEPKLDDAQQAALDSYLQGRIVMTVAEVVAYVRKTFRVRYSIAGMTGLLHRMGFSYRKPKSVGNKADAEAQEAFVKKYRALKNRKKPGDPIYFTDGVHPQHNSKPAYGWIKKGTAPILPSNTGRQRLNLNGAVNIETFQAVVRDDETLNADSTVALLKMLEQKHPLASRIYVIVDNARYYRSRIVRQYVKGSRIQLIFLPPYAPNLNLIERLWKYFRKVVLYNRYYATFTEFKQACLSFFANLRNHRAALRTLLAENFEILSAA
jgi:transposase